MAAVRLLCLGRVVLRNPVGNEHQESKQVRQIIPTPASEAVAADDISAHGESSARTRQAPVQDLCDCSAEFVATPSRGIYSLRRYVRSWLLA